MIGSIDAHLIHSLALTRPGVIVEYGVNPDLSLAYLGDLSIESLEPLTAAKNSLSVVRETYIVKEAARRVILIPPAVLNTLRSNKEFAQLISQYREVLASQSPPSCIPVLDQWLQRDDADIFVSGRLHFYSPAEGPLAPHIDSGDVAIVVAVHLTEPSDSSLRWLDCRQLEWRSVPLVSGSVVVVPGGVLHAVRRSMMSERVTLIVTIRRAKVPIHYSWLMV